MVIDGKKLSFNYFPNKRLKSKMVKGKEPFAVYLRLTFNRTQTSITNIVDEEKKLYWPEKKIEEFNRIRETGNVNGIGKILLANEKILEEIVRKEYEAKGDQFSFKGILGKLA